MIAVGDRDEFYSFEDTVAFYRRLPNAELAILPGAAHGRLRRLRAFVELAEDFLADPLEREAEFAIR